MVNTKYRDDIFVYLIDFPIETKEAVCQNEDSSFSIFINAKLSHDAQLKAYEHALRHIECNDFEGKNVQKIEYQVRHGETRNPAAAVPSKEYVNTLKRLKRQQQMIQKKMKQDEKRVKFLQENFDLFNIAEHQNLYGKDL